MTGHDDFDRTLAGWFEADALSPAPAGGLDRVLDATRHRRPRPAWLAGPGSHWIGEAHDAASGAGARSLPHLGVRWYTVLILLLLIVALLGGAIVVGARLLQPSPLPTGQLGHLAYGLDGDIYVADSDGRNPVRIADGAPGFGPAACGSDWGEGPMWSPDGQHLAYRSASSDRCGGTVVISDLVTKSVASFLGTGWIVSWSPDSTRVATWVELFQTIGIFGVDGVRQALLTVPPGCALPGDFDPVWSPDGTSLVIAGCVVPVDGRTPGRLPAVDPRTHFDIAYSRDGARLAYIAYPESVSLVIAKADGTELRVLAGAVNGSNGPGQGAAYQSPVLSSTGDRVAFIWSPATYDQTSDPSLSIYELRVVDVTSGAVTTLASGSGVDHLGVIRFSPGGDRILFSRSDANYVGTSLWSVNVDGSDAQLLVTGTGWGDWQLALLRRTLNQALSVDVFSHSPAPWIGIRIYMSSARLNPVGRANDNFGEDECQPVAVGRGRETSARSRRPATVAGTTARSRRTSSAPRPRATDWTLFGRSSASHGLAVVTCIRIKNR